MSESSDWQSLGANDLNDRLSRMCPFLDQHTDEEIKIAISNEDFSTLCHLPISVREWLTECPDIWTDIWWYVEIRKEKQLNDFPCVHIAYATSPQASNIIEPSNGVYVILTGKGVKEGIVIGYCPWCAKALNTSTLSLGTDL